MSPEDQALAVKVAKRIVGTENFPGWSQPAANCVLANLRADRRDVAPGEADLQVIAVMDQLVRKHGYTLADALVTVREQDFGLGIILDVALRNSK